MVNVFNKIRTHFKSSC